MTTARAQFDKELEDLNKEILKMGSIIERQIYEAVESLVKKDGKMAQKVIDVDEKVDDLHLAIEEKCVSLIALQQPLARDLRTIFAGIKLVTDLERISDLAVDIAEITLALIDEDYIKPLVDIPRMSNTAINIVETALNSYVEGDPEKAKTIFDMEEEVDNLYVQIFRELLFFMIQDPKTIRQATHLLMVGRHLERIADHGTNIGEMVIYGETGERVKLNT